jgi:hypothetical protein
MAVTLDPEVDSVTLKYVTSLRSSARFPQLKRVNAVIVLLI